MKGAAVAFFACLFFVGRASASDMDMSYCIKFEPDGILGTMTNSCTRDLDVTWCHSDSVSSCTDSWKSESVRAGKHVIVDYDKEDEDSLFTLVYACEKLDNDCLDARNAFKDKKSR